jgi:hypothetical protein
MDNQVLAPTPGQVIVSSTDGERHRDRGDHFVGQEILREVSAGFAATALASSEVRGDVKDARHDGIVATSTAAAAGALASSVTDSKVYNSELHTSEKLGAGFAATNAHMSAGFDRTASDACRIEREILGLGTAQVSGFKDGQATAYQLFGQAQLAAANYAAQIQATTVSQANAAQVLANAIGNAAQVQAAAIGNAAALQATSNFNMLTVQATTNQYQILLDSTKNASASVLLATQNQAATLAAIAECCCEQKALAISEGDKTRQLIIGNQLQNERDKNLILANAYNVLAGRTSPLTPPITPAV